MKSQIEITPLEWDIIETYLDEKNNQKKAVLFKEKLAAISHVEQKIKEVEKTKEEIEDSIKQLKIKEFQRYASAAESELVLANVHSKKSNSKIIWYAAAAMAVALIGLFWMMNGTTNSPEKIFAAHFKPDIGLPLKMGTNNSYGFYEGMVEYKEGNYENAIEQWQVLWEKNQQNDTLSYFLGVANLASGNASEALLYFEKHDNYQQSIFEEDALFYAALAYVKEGNFKAAKALLQRNSSARSVNLLKAIKE